MSNIITLGQITEMTAGDKDNPTWVNDDFEAVITNVKESKTKTNKVYYTATLQDPHASNITLDATFWMNGIAAKQGKVCRFSGQGMKLEAYKGNLKLTIGDKATIHVVGAAQNTATKSASTQTKTTQGQTRTPAATATKRPINGATVGMAINQAIGIIKDSLQQEGAGLVGYYMTPAFGKDLHTLASDIIRVSAYLEAGNLADPSNKRNVPTPEPEPEPMPEPVREPTNGQAFATDGPDDENVPF